MISEAVGKLLSVTQWKGIPANTTSIRPIPVGHSAVGRVRIFGGALSWRKKLQD